MSKETRIHTLSFCKFTRGGEDLNIARIKMER